jgi:hypothetical protein
MVPDSDDALPLISLGTNFDTDMDGLPDECPQSCLQKGLRPDDDDDGDGALDYNDPFPLNKDVAQGKVLPKKIEIFEVAE